MGAFVLPRHSLSLPRKSSCPWLTRRNAVAQPKQSAHGALNPAATEARRRQLLASCAGAAFFSHMSARPKPIAALAHGL